MWQLSFVGFFSIFRITKCEKAILLFDRLFLESASGIIKCARLLLQRESGVTTSLLNRPLSKFFKAVHFSHKLLILSFRFTDMLLC